METDSTTPKTKVGPLTAIAIVVASMVGTGVFGSLGFQVAGIPSGFPIILLWLIGGVISFCGAVCYAEIASVFPRSGGEYHLLTKTWNPFIGFLAGWLSVTVGFAAPIALNATLMGTYLSSIFGIHHLAFSLPTVILVTLVHLGSLTFVGSFQQFFTYSKVVLILVIGVLGFSVGHSQGISFLPKEGDMELVTSGAFAISLIYVLYAYTGWNAAIYMMDEVKKPERNVPLALLIGTLFVTVLYIFVNAAFLYSTPIDNIKGEPEVGLIAAQAILGPKGGMIMGILISFGLISSISSMVWAGPRVSAAIGRDYPVLRFLERTNNNGVPAVAILIQGAIVAVLVLSATFEQLINYVQSLLTISSLMVVIGIFFLRVKRPDIKRPYKAWGYPLTPAIFALTSVYVLWFQIKERTVEFGWGITTLALGALVYAAMIHFSKRAKIKPHESNSED
ncbi:MAG: amino acid permease [Verrucomicrobiales bacterium]|nr:amino acid permease [Verrucomicrobiales bacterium]|tara:strand:+ start:68100 stop:69446 length:1347 start_codon:yes stop_codon:yes gene_type:complete